MNEDLEKRSRSIADSSGFPLQIAVAHVVESSPKWEVYLKERHWKSSEDGRDGFIDLVAIDRNHRIHAMVIECKRVRDSVWVFLVPQKAPSKRTHVRLWISSRNAKWDYFHWADFQAEPACFESQFCAMPGQEGGRRTLLERTATDLVYALESFAAQEKLMEEYRASPSGFRRFYIPVIVTTAELRVACFEPGSISLTDGSVPDDTHFEAVPYVRFRKSFTSSGSSQLSLRQAHSASERTVFVVNAESWSDFLENWEVTR